MEKFDWQASESAPNNYPMQIVGGTLLYHGKQDGLYVPNKSTIHQGWGRPISSDVVGEDLKPLPDRLSITFFSYTENQFYSAQFDLPYEKILNLFQVGYYSPNDEGHVTFDQIVVGVAPGGIVSVWLQGLNKSIEVFSGQAEKVDYSWSSFTSATHISREEYIRMDIEEALKTPEALAALHKNGVPIGLWNSYRTRYRWQPLFTGIALRDEMMEEIKYFNGEQDYLLYPLEKEIAASTRAIPSYIGFTWKRTGRLIDDRYFKLYFDEDEIFAAFGNLATNHQPLYLEMRIELINTKYDFTVWLHNEKESIELKRAKIENYTPGGMRYSEAGPDDME